MKNNIKYVTQYGKGIYKGTEAETNKLLIEITEPNFLGARWIRQHNNDRLGCFNSFEVQKLLN